MEQLYHELWTEEFMEQCNTKHNFRAVPPPPASTASGSSARERKRRRTESPFAQLHDRDGPADQPEHQESRDQLHGRAGGACRE